MPANSAGGTPYALPADPLVQWPATSQSVAAKIDEKAPLASPVFTGNPTAPTPAVGDNDTSIATTAFVHAADALKANLASPALTGTPTAPTAAAGTNTTQLATTAFVNANAVKKIGDTMTGALILPATTAPTNANQAVTKGYIDRRIRNNDHHMAWRKAYNFDAGGLINIGGDLTAAGFTYVSSISATMYSGAPESDKVAHFGVYRDIPGDFILKARYTDNTPVTGSHTVMIAVTGTAT